MGVSFLSVTPDVQRQPGSGEYQGSGAREQLLDRDAADVGEHGHGADA